MGFVFFYVFRNISVQDFEVHHCVFTDNSFTAFPKLWTLNKEFT